MVLYTFMVTLSQYLKLHYQETGGRIIMSLPPPSSSATLMQFGSPVKHLSKFSAFSLTLQKWPSTSNSWLKATRCNCEPISVWQRAFFSLNWGSVESLNTNTLCRCMQIEKSKYSKNFYGKYCIYSRFFREYMLSKIGKKIQGKKWKSMR